MADQVVPISEIPIGQTVWTATETLTVAECVAFAGRYDPQPMHVDAEAAADSIFGMLIASGWHVLSLTMNLVVRARPLGGRPLIGVELQSIRILKPISPTVTLQAGVTVDEIVTSKSGRQFAMMTVETVDADSQETLVRQKWRMLLG